MERINIIDVKKAVKKRERRYSADTQRIFGQITSSLHVIEDFLKQSMVEKNASIRWNDVNIVEANDGDNSSGQDIIIFNGVIIINPADEFFDSSTDGHTTNEQKVPISVDANNGEYQVVRIGVPLFLVDNELIDALRAFLKLLAARQEASSQNKIADVDAVDNDVEKLLIPLANKLAQEVVPPTTMLYQNNNKPTDKFDLSLLSEDQRQSIIVSNPDKKH